LSFLRRRGAGLILLLYNEEIKTMIRTMKKALEYAMVKSENPAKIKEYMEEYFATIGGDRRYRFKWKALSGNASHAFSGIFEYYGRRYYFHKKNGELELEYHNR
jgi:hypothetical protein